jgi:thymidylate synthase ThyX
MKVQYVSLSPTQAAQDENCYSLTPELLAATGARYSRNNEGLDSILSKVDFSNPDKSVDSVFKMLDYGHASIADMAPIALFIDDISLFAAYYLWTLCPTAGGQECSTRYIKLNLEGVVSAENIGLPQHLHDKYNQFNKEAFESYTTSLESWQKIADDSPNVTKIPENLLNSNNPRDIKQVERMKRNCAFDRARVHLPVGAMTGVMMVQSARSWAYLASHLQSHYLLEFKNLGKEIAQKLALGAPRLLKHTVLNESIKNTIDFEFQNSQRLASQFGTNVISSQGADYYNVNEFLITQCFEPNRRLLSNFIVESCKLRANRYSPFSHHLNLISVNFAWKGISFGEIRDLNRHRTGNKYCPLVPIGFYGSLDQLKDRESYHAKAIIQEDTKSCDIAFESRNMLINKVFEYFYFTKLGNQYYFEHTTTADKFIYEMELRTGVGAHYRYAKHCKDVLDLWYKEFPETRSLIFEGSAEPE